MPLLKLSDAIGLLANDFGQGLDPATEINLVCEKLLNAVDPAGSLERVTFIVTADANGEGFIELATRYQAIRGAVENPTSTSPCGVPLAIRNGWYEYTIGNLGMLKSSDPLRGIIPIPKSSPTDPVKYKVPACPTAGSNTYFTCICKLSFQLLENDDDVLPIQNINALQSGLQARAKKRVNDFAREAQLWAQAKEELNEQKDNYEGAAAQGVVQYSDDFELGMLGDNYGWGYGGYGWRW
jgi:hypothetical protein